MMRKRSGLRPLQGVVDQQLKKLHLDQKVREARALVKWDQVVGPQVASATRPDFVRDGVLFVSTKSPAWANELTFHKADILRRLNEVVGGKGSKPTITDLVLRPKGTEGKKDFSSEPSDERPTQEEIDSLTLSERDVRRIEATVGKIQNPELRARLRGTITQSEKLAAWRRANGWRPCQKCRALHDKDGELCPICSLPPRYTNLKV